MIPMIIQTPADVVRELKLYAAVIAIKHGIANEHHFQELLAMNNLLMIAGQSRRDLKHMFVLADNSLKPILSALTKTYFETKQLTLDANSISLLFRTLAAYWTVGFDRTLMRFVAFPAIWMARQSPAGAW